MLGFLFVEKRKALHQELVLRGIQLCFFHGDTATPHLWRGNQNQLNGPLWAWSMIITNILCLPFPAQRLEQGLQMGRNIKMTEGLDNRKAISAGTAEGEGLVGPRPHHFFAPPPPLFALKRKIIIVQVFFRLYSAIFSVFSLISNARHFVGLLCFSR